MDLIPFYFDFSAYAVDTHPFSDSPSLTIGYAGNHSGQCEIWIYRRFKSAQCSICGYPYERTTAIIEPTHYTGLVR